MATPTPPRAGSPAHPGGSTPTLPGRSFSAPAGGGSPIPSSGGSLAAPGVEFSMPPGRVFAAGPHGGSPIPPRPGSPTPSGADPTAPPAGSPTPPTTLPMRAPVGPIATSTWTAFLKGDGHRFEYIRVAEQRTPCIRSLRANTTARYTVPTAPISFNFAMSQETSESVGFPYPAKFTAAIGRTPPPQRPPAPPDEESQRGVLPSEVVPSGAAVSKKATFRAHVQVRSALWQWAVRTLCFGVSHTSEHRYQTDAQPLYVVVGVFARGCADPHERAVFVEEPGRLFSRLHWAAFCLRGVGGTLFSLRRVKRFQLYKCDVDNGTHERVHLHPDAVADLQLLLQTYNRWFVPRHINLAWAHWIHEVLNDGSHDVLKPKYSLELVLGWSPVRISVVVLVPVLLSLAVGLWLNSWGWTDLATIQTAWGTASYVVTAGGLAAALLGILSSITDS